MNLIHRNRVIETRAARFCFRCGPPSPAGQGLLRLPLPISNNKTDLKIHFPQTDKQTTRMREESLAPLGKGDRSGEDSRR